VNEKSVRLEMARGRAPDSGRGGYRRRPGRRPYRARRSNGETATDSTTTSDTDGATVNREPAEPVDSSGEPINSSLEPVVDVDDVVVEVPTDA